MDNLYIGDCSILIYSVDYTPKMITDILGINPTSYVFRETAVDGSNFPIKKNAWFYKIDFTSLDNIDFSLNQVLTIFLTKQNNFDRLLDAEIKIRCFINSDYAQIGFKLSADTLKLLALTKKDFEVSIFSGGGIEL